MFQQIKNKINNSPYSKILNGDDYSTYNYFYGDACEKAFNKEIKKFLTNFESLDGYLFYKILGYNQKYELIATNTKGILVHSPLNWLVFGDTFVEGKNSLFSNKIKNITTEELDKLDNKKYGETLEKIFDRLPNDLNGNNKITLKEIKNIINNFNEIDKDTKDYLLKIINTLIMGIFH